MSKKYHWVDDTIKIDFKLPKTVQQIVDELEEMDRDEDWCYFDRCEFIENYTKDFVYSGELTMKQRDLLCARYHG